MKSDDIKRPIEDVIAWRPASSGTAIDVRWAPHDRLAGTDIAQRATSVLEAALPYWPREVVQLLVRRGWVTLEGEL